MSVTVNVANFMSLEARWPLVYQDLKEAGDTAERLWRNAAQMEFVVDHGRVFVTHSWPARLPALGKLRTQLRLLAEGATTPEEFFARLSIADVTAFLRPEISSQFPLKLLATGLPISGGAVSGRAVFRPAGTKKRTARTPQILVTERWAGTSTQALAPMAGVLELSGGVVSHGAMTCRSMGKPCVAGLREARLDAVGRTLHFPGHPALQAGDWLTLDGATGNVYAGRAKIISRPWRDHPELCALWEIIQSAIVSGHVPASCAGLIWCIWDFMRHGLPFQGPASKGAFARARIEQRRFPDGLAKSGPQDGLRIIPQAERFNYFEIIWGLARTIERHVCMDGKTRRASPCQPLWNPDRQINLKENSQIMGFEFTNLAGHLPFLPEVSNIRLQLDCEVQSAEEAWKVFFYKGFGWRVIPMTPSVKACRIKVNGAELGLEDIPIFYSWLRRREYFAPSA